MQTDDQAEADYRRSIAFNVEAMRSGLFSAALDMAKTMKEADIPNADAVMLTAAVEFTAQLWAQVSKQTGIQRGKSRATLEKELRFYFAKHWNSEAAEATQQ